MHDAIVSETDIAIIGMSCRLPSCKNIHEFWQNLQEGKECIAQLSEDQLRASLLKYYGSIPESELASWLNDPNYVRVAARLENIDLFAATFFGYNPTEAELIDPQQRIFLECAWEALEDAAYNPETYKGLIGVYAGSELNMYFHGLQADTIPSASGLLRVMSNANDYLTTRVSYKLNLQGPGMTVQTACSTSLVAVHVACQSLKSGECDMALAGGVVARPIQEMGYFYQEDGFLSPDGHCRPFDAKAQGTLFANGGVGIVVLKRLAEALADGDNVYAVIKGSATNNDGRLKAGYSAPSIGGQMKVVLEAMAVGDIDPASLSYIEAHGTATPLGDPIEIAALTQAFRTRTQRKNFCAIGALKSNMGHLGAAAGVAGLLKTCLALNHKMIPPSLHYEQPNPQIDFANSPFYVNTQLTAWTTSTLPRRAGVCSFGIGGTNAHVILEEAPDWYVAQDRRKAQALPSWQLLILSAKASSVLEHMSVNLLDYLKNHPELHLADLAFTLQVGRQAFPHRRILVCQTIADAVHQLEAQQGIFSVAPAGEQQVVFMFPGQGPQYVNMGRELYETEPPFREQVDLCAMLLVPHLHADLRTVIYPPTGEEEAAQKQLDQMALAQPALFVIEYALAQLWMQIGVRPAAMIGHGIGEYVAACLAGVLSLQDALLLVTLRGQLMDQLADGAMLAVSLPQEQILPLLNAQLSVAAHNSPTDCVVSGPGDALLHLQNALGEQGIACRLLHVSHASHSQMVEPLLAPLSNAVKKLSLHPAKVPYISNVTGKWITEREATDPEYWARHWRQTALFAEGMQLLLDSANMVLLEVGPGHSLSTLARRVEAAGMGPDRAPTDRIILPSLRHPQTQISDRGFLLNTSGQLWCAGVIIDWSQLYAGEQRRRIPLPTYPFERQRYWVSPIMACTGANPVPTAPTQSHQGPSSMQLRKEPDLTQWFSVPSWKRSPLPASLSKQAACKACWLIFIDSVGLGFQLVSHLRGQGDMALTVRVGTQFGKMNDWEYTIRPASREDYDTLLKDINARGIVPTRIVHMWLVIAMDHIQAGLDYFETAQTLGFYSLLFLTQTLGEQGSEQPQEIAIISNNLQEVMGGEVLCPARATALAVGKVAPHEYPHITFRSIDIVLPMAIGQGQGTIPTASMELAWEQLVCQIIAELRWRSSDVTVAYRGPHRWVHCIESVPLPPVAEEQLPLRQHGVYLITGGLGGIGLALGEYLARQVNARLVLTGRTALPAREEWDRRLAVANEQDAVASKIRQVQRLEESGAEVLVVKADVADLEQMQTVISQVRQRFGDLHGVIHTAGTPGGGLIQLKTPAIAAGVLASKVKGTLVLEAVLKDLHPDFLVLCSSLTALTAEPGQVDYCAANTFLDSFAFYHTAQQKVKTISINWDTWQEVGMAVNTLKPYKNSHRYNAQIRQRLQNGILPPEGVEVFRRVLINSALTQVIVSTDGVLARLKQTEALQRTGLQDRDDEPVPHLTASSAEQRPNLQTPYVAPQNETQRQIATIWQSLLGIEQIGIHDNFIDLGGHSLLGTKLIIRLRDTFHVDISLRTLFAEPTVAGLALVILQKNAERIDDARLLQDLADIEHLTDDEVQALLAADSQQTERAQNI